MKCRVCHQETGRVAMYYLLCSPECQAIFRQEQDKLHAELLSQPVATLPEEVDVPAFERFALRVALYTLRDWPASVPRNRIFEDPETVALRIKDLVIQELPPGCVTRCTKISFTASIISPSKYMHFKLRPRE